LSRSLSTGAEVDGRAQIEEEPRRDLAILDVFTDYAGVEVRAVTFQSI
jgi:hypothetical protein